MPGIRYPVHLSSVETYIRAVNGAPRGLTADESDIVFEYASQITSDIEDAWPVDTSTSRDAWSFEVNGSAGEIGFTLENDVDYASYVHLAGTPPEPPLWETLLPATIQSYAGNLLRDLRTEIAAGQRRITQNKADGTMPTFAGVMSQKFSTFSHTFIVEDLKK